MFYQFQEEIIFGDKEVMTGLKLCSHFIATIIPFYIYEFVFIDIYLY